MSAGPLSRASVARRLLLVFVICWLAMAAWGLGALVRGELRAAEWFRLMLSIPAAPLLAAVQAKSSYGIEAFLWGFGLLPWLLAALAIWRHDEPRWRRLCYAAFVLWWLGLALMGGTA